MERTSQIVDQGAVAGTQAIDRAALLLRLVLESAEPLAVGELADRSGLPKSTTSRLLGSLSRQELVRRAGPRGKVEPGAVLLRYAHRGAAGRDIAQLAQEPMRVLGEASGETVNLAVPGADGVEHLTQVEPRHFLGTSQWVGRTVPYETSAAGKVFVAFGAAHAPEGDGAAVEGCRRDGFATAVDELEPGLSAIAAPVRGATGEVVAALAISGPTLRLPARRLAELQPTLITQARALSARLGHERGRTQAA